MKGLRTTGVFSNRLAAHLSPIRSYIMASLKAVNALSYNRSNVIPAVLSKAISTGKLSDKTPLACFFDIERYESRITSLKSAFFKNNITPCIHAGAVKANPLSAVLKVG